MALKIVKGLWFVFMVAAFLDLLYVYAGFQGDITLIGEGADPFTVSKEVFFYSGLALLTVLNVLAFVIARVYSQDIQFRTWYFGLTVAVHWFLIISFSLISLGYSQEKYDYSRLDWIVYMALGIIVLWAISWPGVLVYRKFFFKNSL